VESYRAILESARRVDGDGEPKESLRRLLDECVQQTGADIGRLYVLRLRASAYLCVCQTLPGNLPPAIPVSFLERGSQGSNDPVRRAIKTRQPLAVPDPTGGGPLSRIIVPISVTARAWERSS